MQNKILFYRVPLMEEEERRPLFRREAINFETTEVIDDLLVVTTPKSWIAILTLLFLFAALTIWSIFGKIPIEFQGKGVLLTSRGTFEVVSPSSGVIKKVNVQVGDLVNKDTSLAVLETQGKEMAIKPVEAGKILEFYLMVGSWIEEGGSVAWVEYPLVTKDDYKLHAFFEVSQGEKIEPGMEAKIALEDVDVKTAGYLYGKVSAVSPFPVSDKAFNQLIGDPQIVTILKQDFKSVIHVGIDLLKDPKNPSSYMWTTPSGYPQAIKPGVIADVQIVIERRRPISYLFPRLE